MPEEKELVWKYNKKSIDIKIRQLPKGYKVKRVDLTEKS